MISQIKEGKSICSGDFNLQRDYHISEINDLLKEKQIKVIFAGTDDVIDKYKELQNHIDNSIVTNLTTGPSNIGSILRDVYMVNSTVTIIIHKYSCLFSSNNLSTFL